MHLFRERLFQFFLPSQCHCCEVFLEEGERGICPDCLSKIRWITPPFCSICGSPFSSKEVEIHLCGNCLTKKTYFAKARSLGYYEGPLQEAIHRWKYEGRASLASFFGEWMAEGFRRHWTSEAFDIVVPVPLHRKRLRERGFNQAFLLARELSRRIGVPCEKKMLRKEKPTVPQVLLSGVEREKGVRGAFRVREEDQVAGRSILLVDDVYTTGATVNECSRVLMAGGAKSVEVFTLAHAIKK